MSEVVDPYLNPSTGVLFNLIGADEPAQLARAEGDLTASRTIQLQDGQLVPPTRDLVELQSLHRHLFQDLFDWAGEVRTVDIRRSGGHPFAPFAGISVNAFHMFAELREVAYLSGLQREAFIADLARFYDALNFIHPFREGNGRTQRLFWSRLSLDAGWILDWRPIHGQQLDEASRIAREEGNLGPLLEALDLCIAPSSEV